ncbi:MAG: hypothetical protein CFE28_01400 [Alphaproteobacteria bacterium PA2]|nr:MAG: hypothetical protein CFE28_01400 [Alphaproteobacteria bacterium PA2]
MTTITRENLRTIMKRAWNYHRGAIRNGEASTFADQLRAAWTFIKGWVARQAAPVVVTRTIQLRSMIASPIRRALGSSPYARTNAAAAGYATSRIGA